MSVGITPDDMAGMIRREIQHRIDEMVAIEIAVAQERIERGIRDKLGQIVTAVAAEYDYRNEGNQLVITVKNRVG
jgi:CRISPR/Cas system type I-B associated protein Csh2 (Cas7 group RAMP superfamily)